MDKVYVIRHKVMVEGKKDGKKIKYTWDLFDKYDPASRIHSMARTTGYSATVALRMIADGVFTQKGVIVPEYFGAHPKCVDYLLKGLRERGVVYKEKVEEI